MKLQTQIKPSCLVLVYHCGSRLGWSGMYTFTAMRTGNKWSPTFAVYGDMGNENAKSVPSLQEEAQRGTIDAVLHVGEHGFLFHFDELLHSTNLFL